MIGHVVGLVSVADPSGDEGERVAATVPDEQVRRPWLAGFAALNAVAAWAGGVGLVAGSIDFGESIDERLPFDSLVVAGLALIVVVAVPLSALAWSAATGGPRSDVLAFGAGLSLIGWIVVQILVTRAFAWFQPAYLAVGASLVAASDRVTLGPLRRGALLVAVGAILAAVGVGLLPHPVKNGLTATSVVSIVALFSGAALVGMGAVSALRGRRRLGALVGGLAVLVVVAVAVSTVAPAVAVTNVPSTEITRTPADEGLDHEAVTLTTADGVELAAWYVPGDNGAGVVVTHGAGSTRSDVLGQAAVLARAGYSVVLIDARGHGDSQGAAMDFGWFGDLDVAAGTGFLASLPGVDPRRIGVVGFSMGGEEAIGAAATDERIRAVVAEGATARQAADKAWLSEVYGWRGWAQEQLEKVQYGITDYLSETSPPTALRTAAAAATGVQFLLITAGEVDDEGHAAAYIAGGADDRVTIWNVEGADHIGGYATRPDEWEQRVVAFLEEHLG